MEEKKFVNPMGTREIKPLLLSMAIPAIISNLFNAIYNIVDQIFIGNLQHPHLFP